VIAVGEAMIDRTPEWLKEFAIQHFGTHDKQVLLAGLGSGVAVAAVLIGIVAFHRRQVGLAGLVLFGVVGAIAALSRPDAAPLDVDPSVIGAFAGMAILYALVRTRRAGSEADRRRFLLMAGGAATVAVVSGGLGRFLAAGRSVDAVRRALRLPSPAERAPAIPSGADLRIPGLTPFTTGNADFYRVDTALVLPQVDASLLAFREFVDLLEAAPSATSATQAVDALTERLKEIDPRAWAPGCLWPAEVDAWAELPYNRPAQPSRDPSADVVKPVVFDLRDLLS